MTIPAPTSTTMAVMTSTIQKPRTPLSHSGGSNAALSFGETAGDITVNVPQTGECTLSIGTSNPQQWTATVEEGSSVGAGRTGRRTISVSAGNRSGH
ncbi:MAG: DUF5114 domain-containing protein [Bacteroides thetaiotaomicron]